MVVSFSNLSVIRAFKLGKKAILLLINHKSLQGNNFFYQELFEMIIYWGYFSRREEPLINTHGPGVYCSTPFALVKLTKSRKGN